MDAKNVEDRPGLVGLPVRRPAGQVRLLLRLSEALSGARTLDEVSAAVGATAARYLGARFAGVAVVEADRHTMRYLDLGAMPESVRSTAIFELSSTRPAAVAAREDQLLVYESREDMAELDSVARRSFEEADGGALAYLPMHQGSHPLGTIAIMWPEAMIFTAADIELFRALARYTAQALERAQLLAERAEVAWVLQSALLPELPVTDWVELAAGYRPAGLADAVGGDWYDAFVLRGTTSDHHPDVVAVVGDVSGHDTQAAAYMGRMQAKLRALARDRPEQPHRLLERLERVMEISSSRHRLLTAVVATLRRSDDGADVEWSNAGHPPPVLVEPGRPARYLDTPPQRLLGMRPSGPTRHTDSLHAASGSTLLFYTDGLVDRRDIDPTEAFDRLLELAERYRDRPPREQVDVVLDELSGVDDDAVALAVHVR
ncbi:PP2C family protein-serine/threonine phosphatase [uncultured Jatrophihabitans sp.]|uniref:PP2C family protein-serine/threonine phosphatase n=1 Tax=uncultured Jatrophihabitans sp. TaxID=1610747 RepID=UPI0035C951FD